MSKPIDVNSELYVTLEADGGVAYGGQPVVTIGRRGGDFVTIPDAEVPALIDVLRRAGIAV